MTRYFKGLYMSFGMFCAIPQPFLLWDERAKNLVLPCFPLLGGFIGALWWGAAKLLILGGVHTMLASAVVSVVPFIISGFLHLDGYLDASDAILSRRPLKERQCILKDPHIGAFAAIMLGVLFVLQFAAVYVVMEQAMDLKLLIVIPVISRCLCSLSILCLSPMTQSRYANMFRKNTKVSHKVFIASIAALGIALSCYLGQLGGLIVAISVVACFGVAIGLAYRNMKGVSGDLAGFALVIGELGGLVAMAVALGGQQ
ncbi:MAG: adenosylcobinamide-GDP ribazoletransferase [Holophagales bacterium]|nr:adenosylcobinamide-GDP ribazoletransferase [Holophagales bacterium]